MANLLQHVAALLYAIIDRSDEVPPDIAEAATDLEPLVTDAIQGTLNPLEDRKDGPYADS